MTQDEFQLLRASFDFRASQTIWELADFRGEQLTLTADGIVKFKKLRTEDVPLLDDKSRVIGSEKIVVVKRDDIIASAGAFKRVA